LRGLILETAARNGMDRSPMGYLRPLLSRGAGPLGLKYSNKLGPATLVIIPQLGDRRIAYTGEIEILSAVFSTYQRPGPTSLDSRIKANNYLTYILAFLEAQDRGADVAILRDPTGYVAEGHAMNLFCVHDGRLYVPQESLALAGITCRNVIRLRGASAVSASRPILRATISSLPTRCSLPRHWKLSPASDRSTASRCPPRSPAWSPRRSAPLCERARSKRVHLFRCGRPTKCVIKCVTTYVRSVDEADRRRYRRNLHRQRAMG
jgi:hypothetical protein